MAEPNVLGIDHPLVTVRDMDAACRAYELMGFRPAPRGRHPWGTANNLILFPHCFIEIIGVYDESLLGKGGIAEGAAFSGFICDYLARRDGGVSLMALHSDDIRADHDTVEARGFKSTGLVNFRRTVTLPDGSKDEAVVSLSVLINSDFPNVSTFICQQHKPHLVWVADWLKHPNKTDGILGVTYVADEPGALLFYYQALYGPEKVAESDRGLRVNTPNGVIDVIPPALMPERFPMAEPFLPPASMRPCGVAIRVRSPEMGAVAKCLAANSVPYVEDKTGVIRVAPDRACGVILEFAEN